MLSTRQYLRNLDKATIKKLLDLTKLNEDEYWILYYCFVDKRMRDNTCAKLNIGTTKYHSLLNEALIKIDFTINKLDKIRTL